MRQKITVTFVAAFSLLLSITGCASSHKRLELSESDQVTCSEDSLTDSTEIQTDTGEVIWVYVCGAVHSPGVYSLKPEDRVAVAIELAGGFLENAKTDYVNLAAQAVDGEKIYIPTVDEILEESSYDVEEGLVNINTADERKLVSISGIGEAKAKAIIDYRKEHGNFKSIDEIKKVSGIGSLTFEKIKEYIKI